MADSLVEMPPISPVAQLVERVERRVGRVAWAAAENVAARPRGQQLFRQADRLMEMMERLARALVRALKRPWRRFNTHGDGDADGDGRDRWGQAPMSLSTAIPLVIIVLPSYMAATLLMMAPYIPILVIKVIFGPSPVIEECWPTPTNAEKCLRRWRRRLRGIRFSGLRKMRIMSITAFEKLEQMLRRKEEKEITGNKIEDEDEEEAAAEKEEEEMEEEVKEADYLEGGSSLLGTVLVWWPITLLTLCGQILGLGNPWIPALKSPVRNKVALENSEVSSKEENLPKSDAENVSPRKRKFMDFEAEDLPTNQEIAHGLGEILHPTLKSDALEAVPDEVLTDSYTDSSSEYDSDPDSDSGTLAGSVDLSKSEIQPKRLSPLAKLLTDSPLSSDDEEDDPNYVPNPDEESADEDDDDLIEDNEDYENEGTCKKIEESIGKESKEFIEMEKESKGMESEKIGEMGSKEYNGIESKKINEMETKECSGKELENSNEKKTKEPMGKLFTEYEYCDKTLTPRSAQSDF